MRASLLFLAVLLVSSAQAQPPAEPSISFLVQQLTKSPNVLPALPLKEARRTLGQARQRYQQGLPAGTSFYLTARVLNEAATPEPVVVLIDTWKGSRISGRIVRLAGKDQTNATALTDFDEEAVLDWILLRADGAEEGNYLGKFLDLEERLATIEE